LGSEGHVRAVDDVDLACVGSTLRRCVAASDGNVVEAVVVEVTDEVHAEAETLAAAGDEEHALRASGERREVVADRVADRGGAVDQVHLASKISRHAIGSPRAGVVGAHEDVHLAVAVEVSGAAVQAIPESIACHRPAEENPGATQTSRVVVRGGVAVLAEEYPHRSGVEPGGGSLILRGRHAKVVVSIAVNISKPTG